MNLNINENTKTDKNRKIVAYLLAHLRAMRFHYQTAHWNVHGKNFISDHEMFADFYNDLTDQLDTLAEKSVSMYNEGITSLSAQSENMYNVIKKYENNKDPISRSLSMEEDLLLLLNKVYDKLKSSGELSLGMDDYIMALANEHEENIYKLEQRMK